MKPDGNALIRLSISGFFLVLLLNAAAHFAAGMPAAIPFSRFWWIAWGPAYLIWLCFLVAGLRGRSRQR
jgi:hypothetical protein